MEHDCFPWNKLSLTVRKSLLELPLRCAFPITAAEANFPLAWNCSPRKRQFQLRGGFFLVLDPEKTEILSFFESDPGVSILITTTETFITDPSLPPGSDPIQQGLMKVVNLR